MKAITIPEFGDEDTLTLADVPAPEPAASEVLIGVAAVGVNRADLLQRQGFYNPPPGESEYPGLEVSGTIREVGADVQGWQVGDQVCALLSGGGYAEQVVVPTGQLLPVPEGVSLVDAAALPEVLCTVWSNVFQVAALKTDETLLIHGGSSGIGTAAIQLAKAHGSRVAVTAGSAAKLEACRELGADVLINYREGAPGRRTAKDAGGGPTARNEPRVHHFVDEVRAATDGRGADVILDVVGAKYLASNVRALTAGGRLVVIGLQGGTKAELNLGALLAKRASVTATSLRARPAAEKAKIVAAVRSHVWPLITAGRVRPIIQDRLPLAQAADAHRTLAASQHIGKVLLTT